MQAGLEDPELLSLRHEMALCSTRVADLLEQIANGAAGALTPAAADAVAAVQAAQRAGDAAALDAALARLAELIKGAKGETRAWRELARFLDLLRRLQLAEVRRLEAMTQYIGIDEFQALLANLAAIILSEIPERERVQRVLFRIRTEVLNRAPAPGDVQLVGASEASP